MTPLYQTRILYIDDMTTIRSVLKKMFDELKFPHVDCAADVPSAWEKIKFAAEENRPYELILSDWNMPQMSGLDLAKMIRAHSDPRVSGVAFVMITGNDGKVREAMDAGVDNYIAKPFNSSTLLKKIEFVMRFSKSKVAA